MPFRSTQPSPIRVLSFPTPSVFLRPTWWKSYPLISFHSRTAFLAPPLFLRWGRPPLLTPPYMPQSEESNLPFYPSFSFLNPFLSLIPSRGDVELPFPASHVSPLHLKHSPDSCEATLKNDLPPISPGLTCTPYALISHTRSSLS